MWPGPLMHVEVMGNASARSASQPAQPQIRGSESAVDDHPARACSGAAILSALFALVAIFFVLGPHDAHAALDSGASATDRKSVV